MISSATPPAQPAVPKPKGMTAEELWVCSCKWKRTAAGLEVVSECKYHAAARQTWEAERARLVGERDGLQQTFGIRWAADRRAIKRWQDETEKNLTWPDHADLCVWLLEERTALLRRIEELFPAIAHGDEKHRVWLQQAIIDHFAGREVHRP